jgi:NADPH:quinone reductase-like Zn-dependent oxidoreductase
VPLRKSNVGVGLGEVVTVHPRVHATTVNRTDCGLRAAKPFIVRFFTGLSRPRVTVLGNEFAGEIEAVGPGVTSFRVGDRVFGYNGSSFGAHAEYMVMPEDGLLATMPTSLTYEEAAPSTETGRDLSLDGPGPAVPASDLGARHAAVWWQEGHVSHSKR